MNTHKRRKAVLVQMTKKRKVSYETHYVAPKYKKRMLKSTAHSRKHIWL